MVTFNVPSGVNVTFWPKRIYGGIYGGGRVPRRKVGYFVFVDDPITFGVKISPDVRISAVTRGESRRRRRFVKEQRREIFGSVITKRDNAHRVEKRKKKRRKCSRERTFANRKTMLMISIRDQLKSWNHRSLIATKQSKMITTEEKREFLNCRKLIVISLIYARCKLRWMS